MDKTLLQVKNLKFSFYTSDEPLQVVRGFDLRVNKGEIVGILGESGSGKTVSTSALIRLFSPQTGRLDEGSVYFNGRDLTTLKEKELRTIRGKQIGFVFQNPTAALNPYQKIGPGFQQLLKLHKVKCSKSAIFDALEEVGLEDPFRIYNMYPHQLSGGQNQRVMIARCVLLKPDLLIADEPTSAIDAALQKKVLDLLRNLCNKYKMSLIMITHDFDAAKYICDRLYIMYGGLVVEESTTNHLLTDCNHPYTKELIKCAQSLSDSEDILYTLKGKPLSPTEFTSQCPFYERCSQRKEQCLSDIPPLETTEKGNVRCFYPLCNEVSHE